MTDLLARAVFGTQPAGDVVLLTRTQGITRQTADLWRETASIAAQPHSTPQPTRGLFKVNGSHYLHAYLQSEPRIYVYTLLPVQWTRQLEGNLALLDELLTLGTITDTQMSPIPLPHPTSWQENERLHAAQSLLNANADPQTLWAVLNAALSKERLLIVNTAAPHDAHLRWAQGMMAFLPSRARADFTFSTYTTNANSPRGRVVFGAAQNSNRWVFDWQAAQFVGNSLPAPHPYIELLRNAWTGDLPALLQHIDALDVLLRNESNELDFVAELPNITARFSFHMSVSRGQAVSAQQLQDAINSGHLPALWRTEYLERLLPLALETKDSAASSLIYAAMDSDSALDVRLSKHIEAALTDAPDLVYAFARQRLSEGTPDVRWLARLHTAAQQSVAVALHSEDVSLILSWLRLIAREPEQFQLEKILAKGVEAALPFAYRDSDFAVNLLALVGRYLPPLMEQYLTNQDFLSALPPSARSAFMLYTPDALLELQNHSNSLFLIGVWRALNAQSAEAFVPTLIERVLELSQSDKPINIGTPFSAGAILQALPNAIDWLLPPAQESLLAVALTQKEDSLLMALTAKLAKTEQLARLLPKAMRQVEMPVNVMLDKMSMLIATTRLTGEQALGVYLALLASLGMNSATQPLMEAASRLLTQNPQVALPPEQLAEWLASAAELRDEISARVSALGLLETLITLEDDESFVERLAYIFSQLAWSQTARNAALAWWRMFVQAQPSARLTRLEGLMSSLRVLEAPLEALRSVAAMRRLFVRHEDSASFVEAVNTTYTLLEALTEAFEPPDRAHGFDAATVRESLTSLQAELSPQQRQILANSLKGMAALVVSMGENRTKGGIGRRSENVDRQLMSGEQTPNGAVDAMKWLAGFFAGTQSPPREE